ncbi:MAG TPA: FmdB family zinc ribbon protein [Candidatus Sulfotelmatobacter sp.]|nr:FmdB family zinc ribbon protein [Candidatus Sulfotelmatobacter sp.]
MPTYAYRCRKCGHEFEEFHSIRDTRPRRCPKCKGRADRVPAGGAGLLFKGSGFYITDYRSKDYQEKASKESPSGGASSGEKKKKSDGGGTSAGGKSAGSD